MKDAKDFYAYCWGAVNPKYLLILARFIEKYEGRVDWFIDPLQKQDEQEKCEIC